MLSPLSDDTRRFEQIRKLTEVSRALTYATSLADVLRLAVDRAAELLEAEQAVVMLTDADGLLQVRAAHGVDDELVREFHEPLNETLIGRLQGLFGGVRQECFLGVPLVVQGEVTGLLAVLRSTDEPCTDADEWLLSALADQAAMALENARLEEEVRQEMQERVRAMEGVTEAKERALSTLAHDLRSPLTAVDSYSELLEMEMLGPVTDRQREALGRIRMSGRHLLAVLESVLEMARLNAGVVTLRTQSVRLVEVLEEATQMVLPSATARDQVLGSEVAVSPVVRADADRLRQVLVNLLDNAIKYTSTGGSIRARTSVLERGGRRWGGVSVSDSGLGIAPEDLEAVFLPYYRIAGNEPGTGLGLAISRELVRNMGGDIDVESKIGCGSTFTVCLPLAGPEAAG
jgi:phosphoserine phosphatase RsbU/P